MNTPSSRCDRALALEEGRQSTLAQIRRVFKKDVIPPLRRMTVHEITRHHLLEVVGRIEKRGSLSMAEKVRSSVKIGNETRALTAYQRKVWQNLPAKAAQVITAPTSAGKSFLVLEHICRQTESSERFTAVYLTPTRALLSEVQSKLHARFGGQPDIRISAVPSLDQLERPKQIFVLTQERLSSLLSVAPDDMSFDIVVVDEAQNIADDARGMILQDCLERIAQTHQRVAHADLLVQPYTEQLDRLRLRRLWTHRTPRRNLQENKYWQNHTLQIPRPSTRRTARQINGLRIVQGELGNSVNRQPSQQVADHRRRGIVIQLDQDRGWHICAGSWQINKQHAG